MAILGKKCEKVFFPSYFAVTGTTGEGLQLTMEERKQLAEAWIKEGKGK